uniref:Uncharacterized protein n=1 Tax=Cucumis melo TaxID=3656 RepID=A0A9I9EEC8_CUCME
MRPYCYHLLRKNLLTLVSIYLKRIFGACFGNALIFLLIASFTPCICLYTCSYRSRLRGKYNLQETPCNDCCVHFWCWSCALCQEHRELKNRGFNMHIGWQENVQRRNRETQIPPTVEGQMKR